MRLNQFLPPPPPFEKVLFHGKLTLMTSPSRPYGSSLTGDQRTYGSGSGSPYPPPNAIVGHHPMSEDQIYSGQHIPQQQQLAQEAGPGQAEASGSLNYWHSNESKARLRKACDACSIRKVKCDEEGPPCRACAALDIPCTFDRPSRRRGPPNRHAEAIRKRKLQSPSPGADSSISLSPLNAAQTLTSFSQQNTLSAESICPLPLLQALIDDYFSYIHPLIPIPHEPTFREAFQRRDDLTNHTFLSLLAAIIGTLVVSFPRRPRIALQSQRQEHLFPTSFSLIERCHRVTVEARGTGFLDKDLNIYDAATSYLLGLTGAYSIKWRQSKLYFGECFTILRTLGLHKSSEPSTPFDSTSRNPKHDLRDMAVDRILEEMGRRTFWLLFVSAKSMHQLGASFTDFFIPPATPRSQYPPLPSEVDDVCIFSDRILQQPLGVVSLITGFNANVRVFLSYDALSTMDMTYGTDESVDWDKQKLLVQRCLAACRTALEGVPRELKLRQDNTSFSTAADGLSRYQQLQADDDILGKRQTQFEIQKANIYVSQLGTRSYILEKYWTLCERNRAQKAGMSHTQSEQDMEVEREAIVRELLFVLNSISIVNMEPNGGNQINRIRQIASTLLQGPQAYQGTTTPNSQNNERYLAVFLDILMKLERVAPTQTDEQSAHSGSETPVTSPMSNEEPTIRVSNDRHSPNKALVDSKSQSLAPPPPHGSHEFAMEIDGELDEEADLRQWTHAREYQGQFAQAGGDFLAEL